MVRLSTTFHGRTQPTSAEGPSVTETAAKGPDGYYAGSRGLKIDGVKGTAVTLPPFRPLADQSTDDTVVKLNPNGSATVTETSRSSGDAARLEREKMKQATPSKIRNYLTESYKRSGRKLLDFYMTDPEGDDGTFEIRVSYTVPRFGSLGAGGLVFKMGGSKDNGNWISQLNLPRQQPFRFYASDIGARKFTVELPVGAVLKGQPEDVQIDTAFLKASRKVQFANNRLSVTETTGYRDAHVPVTEASQVAAAFQKLQDHRDYSFVVQLPSRTLEPAK